MTTTDLDLVIKEGESPASVLARATTPAAKRAAAKYALSEVQPESFKHPIPVLFLDFPWPSGDDDVVEDILLGLIESDDIAQASQGSEVLKADDLVGQTVTLLSVRARRSDLDDARWGAYLLLRAQLESGEVVPVATGAAQVIVTLWRMHVDGALPVTGQFVKLGQPVKGRNQPIGFRIEPAF
jgi:hypothetical protein